MTTTMPFTFDDVLGALPPSAPRCGRAGGTPGLRHRGREGLRAGSAPPGQQLDLSWERGGVGGGVVDGDGSVIAIRISAAVDDAPGGLDVVREGAGVGGAPAGAGLVAGVSGATTARGAAAPGAPGAAAGRNGVVAGAAGAAGSGPRSRPPGPRRPAPRPGTVPTPRAAVGLLRQATAGVAEAHDLPDPLRRYPAAYLAALRAAAAVLAVRAAPAPKRRASRSVWSLLADVAPEFAEWAAFFASCSATRSAAEAGIARLVGRREADDLLRQAEQFVGLVGENVVVAA